MESVIADDGDTVARLDPVPPETENCTNAPAIGAPVELFTTAVTVAGCEALIVLLVKVRMTEPAVLDVTLVVVVEPEPVVPVLPFVPVPKAALPDVL